MKIAIFVLKYPSSCSSCEIENPGTVQKVQGHPADV